jgi:protein-L-isoaspartate(D-aspartate) O-methyltransferase
MAYIDFLSPLHKSTQRDYLARVNDTEFPKFKAAELAKKWAFDYWDGDRRINYGGYKYIEGRWEKVAKLMAETYGLKAGDKILDIGCGKGFLLYDFTKIIPGIEVYGLDISDYAIDNSKEEVRNQLIIGNATSLPWPDKHFDFVFSLNTFHNLHNYDLEKALKEIERVGKKNKYICVESYRNEIEKTNLLYWQVTCEAFCTPEEWEWWFSRCGYTGDFSFIYFE